MERVSIVEGVKTAPTLVIVTTVSDTVTLILKDQLCFLRSHYHLVLVTSPGGDLRCMEECGVDVIRLSMSRGINIYGDFFSIVKMTYLFYKLSPDIVHSYTPKAGLISMISSGLLRVPCRVHTFTGLIWPTRRGIARSLLMLVDMVIAKCATHVIPESSGVLSDLNFGNITRKSLQVIGCGNIAGVNTSYFSTSAVGVAEATRILRSTLQITSQAFVYVFVGRLSQDKGLEELFDAFTQLPSDCHLLIVGAIDGRVPIERRLLTQMCMHPRIHPLGFQADIRPALLAADIFVLPSYREGFPNVILQAGAMELPIVASDVSGCNDFISSGSNGWLIPPKDVGALCAAMLNARLVPGEVRCRMGKISREAVVKSFEQGAHCKRMLGFYQSLLGAASPEPNETKF